MSKKMDYANYDNERYMPNLQNALELGLRSWSVISRFMKTTKDINILEIGCASGSLLFYLKTKGFQSLKGIDLDEQLIAYGKDLYGLELNVASWESYLKEESVCYDLIVALDVLEHLDPFNVQEIMDITFQHMSNKGVLVLRFPNANCPFVLPTFFGDLTHKLLLTPELVKHILLKSGFTKVIFHETKPHNIYKKIIYLFIHNLFIGPLIKILHFHFYGQIPKYITRNIYCVAHR